MTWTNAYNVMMGGGDKIQSCIHIMTPNYVKNSDKLEGHHLK